MNGTRALATLLALTTVTVTGAALAEPTVRLDRFTAAPGNEGLFQTEGVPEDGPPTVGLFAEHAARPLVLDRGDGSDPVAIVSSQTTLHVVTDVPATSFLRLSIVVPIVVAAGDPEEGAPRLLGGEDVVGGPGLGDAIAFGRVRFFDTGSFALGASLALGVPTATGSYWNGSGSVTGEARVTSRLDVGPVRLLADAGGRTRPTSTIMNVDIGSEISMAVGVRVSPVRWFDVGLELLGDTGVTGERPFARSSSRLEALARVRVSPREDLGLDVGGGLGLVNGYGTPAARFLVGVTVPISLEAFGYVAPAPVAAPISGRAELDPVSPSSSDLPSPDADSDGDGIPDVSDRCVHIREDVDGILDRDGCPEHQNDLGAGEHPVLPREDGADDDD